MLEQLGKSLMIFDGPLGSMLARPGGALPELLTLESAGVRALQELYRTYLDCGAEVLTTDTFAASRHHLEKCGAADQLVQINRRAVEITREVAAGRAAVAASVGPLDCPARISEAELRAIYDEQIEAHRGAAPDLLLLETFAAPREAAAAIAAAAASGIPFAFSLNGSRFGQRASRPLALKLARTAAAAGACLVGVNCAAPYLVSELAALLLEQLTLPVLVSPNAGVPELRRGRISYHLNTSALLAEAENWYRAGVAAIGCCCGMKPEQLRELSAGFRGRPVLPRATVTAPPATPIPVNAPEIPENPLRERLRGELPLLALELRFPPLGDRRETLELASELSSDPGVIFTIPDCPTGNPGCDPLAAAALLLRQGELPVMIHQAAGNANLGKAYGQLFGAWELGARGVLAVSGDSPSLGPFGRLSSRVGDIANAVELLKLLTQLGQGTLVNEQPLKRALPFVRGCAYSPGRNPAGAAEWLRQKLEAGAEAVFTQPIFTVEQLEELLRVLAFLQETPVKLFVGVLPLTSRQQAQRLAEGMIPGVALPPEALARMSGPDPAAAGLELAGELVRAIRAAGQQLYLVPPFARNKFDMVRQLYRAFRA